MKQTTLRLLAQVGVMGLMLGIADAGAAANNVPNLLCSGSNDHAPVYLFQAANGALSRMEVMPTHGGSYTDSYIDVSLEALLAECANGTSIAVLPVPQIEGLKRGVLSLPSLPSSFTIKTSTFVACKYGGPPPDCRRNVWGNFWVPSTMPPSDNAHIVRYDFAQSGFSSAVSGTHFVNSLLTVSNSNFATEFQGKGLIIGMANSCPGSGYNAIIQTWQNNPTIPTSQSQAWYDTCVPLSATDTYHIVVGANRDQAIAAWIYPPGAANPIQNLVSSADNYFWSSPSWLSGGNPGQLNPYSTFSYTGHGASGVAFFVATFAPVASTEIWSLSFNAVSSVTQP